MFGHQDDNQNNQAGDTLTAPVPDATLEHEQTIITPPAHNDFNPALPASDSDQPGGPAASAADFTLPTGVSDNASSVLAADPEPEATPAPLPPTEPVVDAADTAPVNSSDGLLDIKQQALMQLTPLVDQLDQSPEEKFRTTMMMIQAADNKDLVPKAYEAAQSITDEKVKAQALLDIVNEINYFTQHNA